jgi:hypothetical protein
MRYKKRYEQALKVAVINQREVDRLEDELRHAQSKILIWRDFAYDWFDIAQKLADKQ